MLPETIESLELELKKLNLELEEMEIIYGQHFPEPSEQLDQWNEVYDRYWRVIGKIEAIKKDRA